MPEPFSTRLKHAWNAFMNRDPPKSDQEYRKEEYNRPDPYFFADLGYSSSRRPDRPRFSKGNERSIVTSVYNRLAIDCAQASFKHVRLDENDRYVESIDSGLNYCLNTEANRDQTGRMFMQDIFMSMFDEGCVAVVPVDTTISPYKTASYDIQTMRTAKIIEWFPAHVRVRLYNDRTGKYEEITVPKASTAIIENPFYSIMNEPNSTLQRLIRKLNILDAIDEQSGAGKLDLIIQLPYIVKTEARKQQAELRRKSIEDQLANTKYGIAYTDGTEKVTQLNRPLDNNLMKQIEYLTEQLYSQLGITTEILNGTADEKAMLNYNNRTIEPLLSAVVDEFSRKFLTKTARSQRQTIKFFKDPFKLVPVDQIAEIADKFTRNEIMSSNEVRQIVGMKPVQDPMADQLRNKNLNVGNEQKFANTSGEEAPAVQPQNEGLSINEGEIQNAR